MKVVVSKRNHKQPQSNNIVPMNIDNQSELIEILKKTAVSIDNTKALETTRIMLNRYLDTLSMKDIEKLKTKTENKIEDLKSDMTPTEYNRKKLFSYNFLLYNLIHYDNLNTKQTPIKPILLTAKRKHREKKRVVLNEKLNQKRIYIVNPLEWTSFENEK